MTHKQKSTRLYAHPFSKSYWRDAAAELKDTHMLVIAALMIALRVAMKGLAIPLAPNLMINTGFFVNALGAMIYGPVVAIIGAAISDTIGCMLFSQGPYFFPFIFIEIASSLFFALFLYRSKVSTTRIVLSRFCVNFFVNIVFNMPIMALFYRYILGKDYTWLQLPAIAKNLCLFPVEAMLLVLFMSVMVPVVHRLHLIYSSGEELKLTKKLAFGLCGLFVASTVITGGYLAYNYNTSNQASWLDAAEKQQLNTALTEQARQQGLVKENQVCIIKNISKKLGQEQVNVTFNVYDVAQEGNLEQVMKYRSTDAKKDNTLTEAGGGSAQTVKSDLAAVTAVALDPAK